jgi:lysophospholipase L1-like esterase
LLIGFLSATAHAQAVASFPPNDARILYSGYACAETGADATGFDRHLLEEWVCGQEEMSPGVRATFLVDASHVRFEFVYHFAGFLCGSAPAEPLSWEFGLAVDGVRRPIGSRNPLYPLSGGSTPWVWLDDVPGPHEVTLVWPSGADVDLTRIHLMETRDASAPLLLAPPTSSNPRLAMFGDSVTHGLGASHVLNTFPVRLEVRTGWEIVNLGFAGRSTVPTDAWLAAGFPDCTGTEAPGPDILMLEIGSNDFHLLGGVHTKLDRFERRYRQWLELFRSLRPTTPVLCLTPLPRGDECAIRVRRLEDYRESIRRVVEQLADPRIYLFEGRDLIDLPPQAGDPLFDPYLLHPNDQGQLQIADRLDDFNLARNAGFELRPLAGCVEVAEPEPYLWTDLGPGTSTVTETADGKRVLALSPSGTRAQSVYGLSAGDQVTLRASVRSTLEGHVGRITLEYLDAKGGLVGPPLVTQYALNSWRTVTLRDTAPSGTVRARLVLAKGPGPGQFLVDELSLTVLDF